MRNLAGGLALFGLCRRAPDRFVRNFDQIALLLVLGLLVWAGLDTLHSEPGSKLALDGLYGWAFYLFLLLFAISLVGRAYGRQADTRGLLVPALSVAPFVLAAFWLIGDVPQINGRPGVETVVAVLYLIALSVRLQQAAYSHARAKPVALAIVIIIGAPYFLQALDLDTRLWLTDDTQESSSDDDGDVESLLYDQPGRIVAAAEQLQPRKPHEANVFYLGFAGDGEQGIFKREALFAEQVFGKRFGSSARSIELINDNEDRDTYPIASVTGLTQALKLIASRLDLEQDVLVLMLTSHGSQDELAVINGSVPLAQLTPADLRHALDDSGIKWRVVVVSACYSGIFSDALKGEDTLIMTAADATHTSFGCEDNRDLTYFGEALLRDSIPTTHTLEEAFRKARGLIAKRETAEHLEHSNPQFFEGNRMRAKLAAIESGSASGQDTIVANH